MMKELFKAEKAFFSMVLKLAVPIALQNLMQSFVGFTDIAMVSQLGKFSTAAVGLGSQVFFAVCVAIFGIASGGAVFISRSWGKKDFTGLQHFTGITVLSALILAIPLTVVCYLKATDILLFFSKNEEVARIGKRYLELTAFSFPLTAITVTLSIQLRCVEKSHYPMFMSVASLIVNVLLNYMLIFGNWGMPAWGVDGAAVATLSARAAETFVTIILFLSKGNPAKTHIKAYFSVLKEPDRKELISAFLKLALPIMMMEIGWALGQGTYKLIYARMGIDEIAAYTAIESIMNLFGVIFIGMGNTAAIMIGKQIGSGHISMAETYAKRFIRLNFLLVIPMSILLALSMPLLVTLYKFDSRTSQFLEQGVLVAALFLSLKSFNFLMMSGILRAGGDGRFIAIIAFIGIIGIGCSLSFLVAFGFKKPFIMVFLVAYFEENLRNIACLIRYKSKRWLKLDVASDV